MVKFKSLISELKYPLAGKEDLQAYGGMEGWKGKLVWMPPEKFLKLAHPLPEDQMNKKSYLKLKDRMINGLPLDFLVLEVNMKLRKVVGHEGRHRAIVAKELGIQEVPVLIYTGSGFDRVPNWNKSTHDIVDKHDFKPEWEK